MAQKWTTAALQASNAIIIYLLLNGVVSAGAFVLTRNGRVLLVRTIHSLNRAIDVEYYFMNARKPEKLASFWRQFMLRCVCRKNAKNNQIIKLYWLQEVRTEFRNSTNWITGQNANIFWTISNSFTAMHVWLCYIYFNTWHSNALRHLSFFPFWQFWINT